MKIATLLVVSALASAPMAWAEGALDPGDPGDQQWNQPGTHGESGKMTVQGDRPLDAPPPAPPVPLWVSAPATLVVAGAGFALVVPQLSIKRVLGFRSGADRPFGYLGLGLLALSPALGLSLSGGGVGTTIMGPILEATLIGAAFGGAYLANLVRSVAATSTWERIGVNDVLGIGAVAIDVVVITAASLFPVLIAFLPGSALDLQDERGLPPLDAVGLIPTRGGAILSVGWTVL